MKRKILILEFWGLGDLSFALPFLRGAFEGGHEVHLVGKRHAHSLLEATFPNLRFIEFDAPWSQYLNKYDLLKWDWMRLTGIIRHLRQERYDAVVSVRNDPRDHLLMWLLGVRERIGFPRHGSGVFLTHTLRRSLPKQHKVEDWSNITAACGFPTSEHNTRLDHAAYRSPGMDQLFSGIRKPVICLHTGARITVRRWPYFQQIVERLRREFDFHLLLIPEPHEEEPLLAGLADTVLMSQTIPELVDILGRVDLLLCNDSGPGHIAAACGTPVIALFGPSDQDLFRPWGDLHKVIIRDVCPWRPCYDYCEFSEPHCMTKLLPEHVWPDIREQIFKLMTGGILPAALLKPVEASQPLLTPLA